MPSAGIVVVSGEDARDEAGVVSGLLHVVAGGHEAETEADTGEAEIEAAAPAVFGQVEDKR